MGLMQINLICFSAFQILLFIILQITPYKTFQKSYTVNIGYIKAYTFI